MVFLIFFIFGESIWRSNCALHYPCTEVGEPGGILGELGVFCAAIDVLFCGAVQYLHF